MISDTTQIIDFTIDMCRTNKFTRIFKCMKKLVRPKSLFLLFQSLRFLETKSQHLKLRKLEGYGHTYKKRLVSIVKTGSNKVNARGPGLTHFPGRGRGPKALTLFEPKKEKHRLVPHNLMGHKRHRHPKFT